MQPLFLGSICSAALDQSCFSPRECAIFSPLALPLLLPSGACRSSVRAVTVASSFAVDDTKCAVAILATVFRSLIIAPVGSVRLVELQQPSQRVEARPLELLGTRTLNVRHQGPSDRCAASASAEDQ